MGKKIFVLFDKLNYLSPDSKCSKYLTNLGYFYQLFPVGAVAVFCFCFFRFLFMYWPNEVSLKNLPLWQQNAFSVCFSLLTAVVSTEFSAGKLGTPYQECLL